MTPTDLIISQRIAEHLINYPLAEPSDEAAPSDQLLNDVLDHLRMYYPGAYSHFIPPIPPAE